MSGDELWLSDGTAAGTRLLRDINVGAARSSPYLVGRAGRRTLLHAQNGSGCELWATDGTTAGTRRVADICPSPWSGRARELGAALVFSASSTGEGREPCISDGASATLLGDICPGTCSSDPELELVAFGGVLFSADDGVAGRELWFSDGTPSGTRRGADIAPGSCAPTPGSLRGSTAACTSPPTTA